MTELEKVRKGLYMCEGGPENCGLKDCPYFDKREFCENELHREALALLKEQEPVEPIYGLHGERHCGNCRNSLWVSGQRFCASCGRAVKWDA